MPVRIEVGAEPIPGYRLLNRIGGGGFGEVWRAEAPGGLLKAIKFVYGDLQLGHDEGGNRAQQELKALARVRKIRHPFILSLERFDVVDGQLIIVMELADRSLWDRFRECRSKGLPGIPRAELLAYLEEAAEALDLMNIQYDLQHLDIKPQNLFLVHNHVKVADFGLVKDLQGLAASVTGGVTPVYAAPETFNGWVSRYSDQYSLAIVYMELLTGVRPFKANTPQQLIQMHLSAKPDLTALPAADRAIIGRALAKTPHERHPSCLEMVQALRHAGGETRRVVLPGFAEATDEPAEQEGVASPVVAREQAMEPPVALTHSTTALTQAVERRSERLGTGVLVPALVVSLGGWGLAVLQRFTSGLCERYGALRELPHLRLLHLDTDPDSQRGWGEKFLLEGGEIVLTRLQRPARYLRPRDHLPDISEWLDPQILYRMPRSLLTGGVRALGRLAFVEHYRSIRHRLEQALHAITQPQALEQACQRCQLEMRSDWPVVIVVAHLAGGTGSGMLLDVAYVVRQLLSEMGYQPPRVLALLGVSDPEAQQGNVLALANMYAALRELEYFQSGGRRFTARYEAKGPPLQDVASPFRHCVVVCPGHEKEGTQQAADWLYRELLTPLGRQADLLRNWELGLNEANVNGSLSVTGQCSTQEDRPRRRPQVSVFGLASVEHPRRQIVKGVALHLAARLARHWSEAAQQDWASYPEGSWQELVTTLQVEPTAVKCVLDQLAREALQADFAIAVRHNLEQLQQQYVEPPLYARAALQLWEDWLGNPDELAGSWRKFAILQPWREYLESWAHQLEETLQSWVWHYLEIPGVRFAGAEAALQLAVAQLDSWSQTLEGHRAQIHATQQAAEKELDEALSEWERWQRSWVRERRADQRRQALQERFLTALEKLAMARYERVASEELLRAYLSLRGRLSDQSKELSFCRRRLQNVAQQLADACSQLPQLSAAQGYLYVRGGNLAEAVEQALAELPPELCHSLDERIQLRLQQEGTSLQRLCTASGDSLAQLHQLIVNEVENCLNAYWPNYDVADLLISQQTPEQIATLLQQLYYGAEPTIASATSPRSMSVMALPGSPSGLQLADCARTVLPSDTVFLVSDAQEVFVYREWVGIRFEDLPQLDTEARRAYEQACSLEHFTPHCRMDLFAFEKATLAD